MQQFQLIQLDLSKPSSSMGSVPDIASLMRGPAGSHGGNGKQTDIASGMTI